MDTSNLLTILGIAIALSAYLSAIRLMAIQKISDISKDDPKGSCKKWDIRKKLGLLTLADIPIVLSAFFLGLHLLWNDLRFNFLGYEIFSGDPYSWLLPVGLWLFLIAGTVMVLLHVFAWIITCSELLRGNKTVEKKVESEVTTVKKEQEKKPEASKLQIEVQESSGEVSES
ncbi:hypothetical protein [Gimesia aquarii]|nr:hypothetical protein [Gimesia aquarii]